MLIDVLLHEQLREIFGEARRSGRGLNAHLLARPPEGVEELFGGRGAVVRLEPTEGPSLLVTPRGISREEAAGVREVAAFTDLVGYDWISEDLSEKVEQKDDHFDRLFLHLQGERTEILDHLGDAVYPLMTYLGKVLELRSQKVIRRRMDPEVDEVVSTCLRAAVEGPFFSDADLEHLFEQSRASLTILAGMWTRMNLASPDLRRTVESVLEMLAARRRDHPDAWERLVGMDPARVARAKEAFARIVAGDEADEPPAPAGGPQRPQ